jgi:hypothetical protein
MSYGFKRTLKSGLWLMSWPHADPLLGDGPLGSSQLPWVLLSMEVGPLCTSSIEVY